MIDVLTRLAELDAKNPNIVKENADLAECGPMGMMGGMSQPQTPASVNITAGSGQELSAMLKDIMSLAGIHKVEPEHLGIEHDPMTLTAEPVAAVGPMPTAGDDMRSVIDKLNPDTDGEQDGGENGEEADEGLIGGVLGGTAGAMLGGPAGAALGYVAGSKVGDDLTDEERMYNNSGNTPTDVPPMSKDAMLNKGMQSQENPKNAGFGRNTMQPNANATAFESLMAEYKKFISENTMNTMMQGGTRALGGNADHVNRASETLEIGQKMANDGITYSAEKENEIIGLMTKYMKDAGMSSKAIRYNLSYDEDYIPDQLSYLPRSNDNSITKK